MLQKILKRNNFVFRENYPHENKEGMKIYNYVKYINENYDLEIRVEFYEKTIKSRFYLILINKKHSKWWYLLQRFKNGNEIQKEIKRIVEKITSEVRYENN